MVLHAHSNLSAQQPPALYSHIHTQTVAQKSVPSSHLPFSSIHLWSLLHMTDRSWLWVLSPLLPVFSSFCFAFTCWHTHTHRHTHTDTDRHRQTHTQTQLLSKAMRQLGWWIVYYKVAGIERPEYGSICMSVYEFHLSVSSFWSLLGNVNGVVNKLLFFHLILSIAKQITIRNTGGFTFISFMY